jgi:hypothetical protein
LFDSRNTKAHQPRLEFQKRGQLFIGAHNETLSVAAVHVGNAIGYAMHYS